jgi:hypothetical protein
LVVKYKDNGQKSVVPKGAEIITFAAATAAYLKLGEKIFVFTAKKLPNATVEARNVSFGDYAVWRAKSRQSASQQSRVLLDHLVCTGE